MQTERYVRLFKNGRNQALRIPKAFELPGNEAVMIKDKERLIIKPVKRPSLLSLLETLEPIDDDFPETDNDLIPLDDIEI
jgi:antitoxin VapB